MELPAIISYIFIIELKKCIKCSVARVVKKTKVYFMDTGLACYLAGYIDNKTLEKSAYNGAIFETYVISEIIKSFPGTEAIKNFSVVNKFGMNVGNGGVICMKSELFPIDKNNNYIPIELI